MGRPPLPACLGNTLVECGEGGGSPCCDGGAGIWAERGSQFRVSPGPAAGMAAAAGGLLVVCGAAGALGVNERRSRVGEPTPSSPEEVGGARWTFRFRPAYSSPVSLIAD